MKFVKQEKGVIVLTPIELDAIKATMEIFQVATDRAQEETTDEYFDYERIVYQMKQVLDTREIKIVDYWEEIEEI